MVQHDATVEAPGSYARADVEILIGCCDRAIEEHCGPGVDRHTGIGTVKQDVPGADPGFERRVEIVDEEAIGAGAKFGLSLLGKVADEVRLPLLPVSATTRAAIRSAMIHAELIAL